MEAGLALAEIRDLRLYRHGYRNFTEYCQKKWVWTRQHAYWLIETAPVRKCHQLVTNESVARELAKVDLAQRAGVVQEIVDQGKRLTAAAVKQLLPPPPMVRPDGAQGTAIGTVLPPPPSQVLDATGWPIPTQLIPLWQRSDEVQEMLTALSRVKGTIRAAQENKDKLFPEVNFSSAPSQLDQA